MTKELDFTNALRSASFSHVRNCVVCGVGVWYVYHRDAASPSGSVLAAQLDAVHAYPILKAEGLL